MLTSLLETNMLFCSHVQVNICLALECNARPLSFVCLAFEMQYVHLCSQPKLSTEPHPAFHHRLQLTLKASTPALFSALCSALLSACEAAHCDMTQARHTSCIAFTRCDAEYQLVWVLDSCHFKWEFCCSVHLDTTC